MTRRLFAALVLATTLAAPAAAQEQMADPDFRPVVTQPTWTGTGPRVVIDEAHGSVQTVAGRYGPFAALLRADGYRVTSGTLAFDDGGLDDVDILVISNAAASRAPGVGPSAFTAAEIEAVQVWVHAGGSLLLAADHAPHGAAAEALGAAFGVSMGKGYAFRLGPEGLTTTLDFMAEAGDLGDHPILSRGTADQAVRTVRTFTGQSLSGPSRSTILLALRPGDREAPDLATMNAISDALDAGEDVDAVLDRLSAPVDGRAQGLAFTHGDGRVVVLGEAGMLSAQIVRFPEAANRPDRRMGLNVPGHDDQQFALNVLRWLSLKPLHGPR